MALLTLRHGSPVIVVIVGVLVAIVAATTTAAAATPPFFSKVNLILQLNMKQQLKFRGAGESAHPLQDPRKM